MGEPGKARDWMLVVSALLGDACMVVFFAGVFYAKAASIADVRALEKQIAVLEQQQNEQDRRLAELESRR